MKLIEQKLKKNHNQYAKYNYLYMAALSLQAAKTVGLMIRHTPYNVFLGVTRSHGVGLFTKHDTLTIYPENRHLADTAACHSTYQLTCH